MHTAFAAGGLMRDLGLLDTAAYTLCDEFFMTFAARGAVIHIRNSFTVGVKRIGVDTGECAYGTGSSKRPCGVAVRYRYPLATLNNGKHFFSGENNVFEFIAK